MTKSIIIEGVEYELKPKLQSLSDEQFVNYLLDTKEIGYRVGDIVWYKGEELRKECGRHKFKVLSIEPYQIQGVRVNSYLNVKLLKLDSKAEDSISFLTTELEKCCLVVN